MNSRTTCLLLFLDKKTHLKKIVGDDRSFFNKFPSPAFLEEARIDEYKWTQIFTSIPEKNKESQNLWTHEGEEVFYIFKAIEKPSDNFFYIIILLNLSASVGLKKLSVKNNFLKDDINLIMDSPAMQRIINIIKTISNVDSTVLLLGESGVGKSAIANLIHKVSIRANKPFVSINCAAMPEALIESELFGYEHGSFTGGKKGGNIGLFETAEGGTVFLDEIAELPLNMQAKLLGVLQEKAIRRVGGTEYKSIDVRIIAATNKDIVNLVKEKKFREDLFYRLNVVPLTIPPLRERKADLSKIIDYFVSKVTKKYGLVKRLTPEIHNKLINYSWPGNIRELENTIERIVVTNFDEEIDGILHSSNLQSIQKEFTSDSVMPLKKAKKMLEKELILKAYELYGSTYKAAKVLEVDQSTVAKKVREYNKNKE